MKIATLLAIALTASPCYGALTHHYDFSTDVSDSVGSADGTLLGGASVNDGVLNLDGVDDYVQFGSQIVPISGSYTVAFFARQISNQATHVEMISQGAQNTPGFYIGLDPNSDVRATDSWIFTNISYPSDNQIHHLAFVVDSSGNDSHLYLDGVLQGSFGGSAIHSTTAGTDTRLGRQFGGFEEYFHGTLDDVRIYDSALSGNDISALAAVPLPGAVWFFGSALGMLGLLRRKAV